MSKLQYEFRSHPEAPLFEDPIEACKHIAKAISLLEEGTQDSTEYLRTVLRQASLTSLWFFLKFIAGYAGPYNLLNKELHLDMCNFRQSDYCMSPGARWAAFIPRGGLKSTIFTHGAASWECLRDHDIRMLITNSVDERARDFTMNVLRTFRNNEMIKWLFPDFVIPKGQAHMTLPNRSRFYTEPNVAHKGYGGELAGTHVNHILFDDVIGVEDLDSQMMASVSMDRAKKKFHTASRALLVKPVIDRVGVIGTRYCIGDLYEDIVGNCKQVFGCTDTHDIKPIEGGEYTIYYRRVIEKGVSIDPETYTIESMERLRIDDPWSFYSQYDNNPKEGSNLEFYKLPINRASLIKDGGWTLRFDGITQDLPKLYIAVGVDFAASERQINASTSRSAIVMIGMDGQGRKFLLREVVGFMAPRKVIEELFKLHREFDGYIHRTILESNALQKFFIPLIREMAMKEDFYFPAEATPVSVPKEVRIRAGVGAALAGGDFYVVEGEGQEFIKEKDVFPQDRNRRDVLDAASKPLAVIVRPLSEDEEFELEEEEEVWQERLVGKAGY